MASLVAVADWSKYTPVAPPSNAEGLLEAASGAVRDHCGWSISAESNITHTVDGSGSTLLMLPTLLLTAVSAVTLGGVALVADVDYTWSADGYLIRDAGWGRRLRSVAATIDHGYTTVPVAVAARVVQIAARAAVTTPGMAAETAREVSVTYAPGSRDTQLQLTPGDEKALERYRIP